MRVLVVSANRLAQAGLGALVEQAEGLEVAGALSPEDAADEVARGGAEAVLIDAAAGEGAALAVAAGVIAVLTAPTEVVAAALAAGADAVLPAAASSGALARALAAAAEG